MSKTPATFTLKLHASTAKRVFFTLMAIICCLTLLNLVAFRLHQLAIESYWLAEGIESLVRLLDTNGEANIPSWYSSSALLVASALLFTITVAKARNEDRYRRHWQWMAVLFLYLSLDETALLHEMLSQPLRLLLHTDGFLYYPWILAAGICLGILCIVYAKFLLDLPVKSRFCFLISGTIFISGAIGCESYQAYLHSMGHHSREDFIVPTTIEEFLEMTGIALFIFTLIEYLYEQVLNSKRASTLDRAHPGRLDALLIDRGTDFQERASTSGIDQQSHAPNA